MMGKLGKLAFTCIFLHLALDAFRYLLNHILGFRLCQGYSGEKDRMSVLENLPLARLVVMLVRMRMATLLLLV